MSIGLLNSANTQILLNVEEGGMGEIRVKVKLVNAVDHALAGQGRLASDHVRSATLDSVVDTGAVRSVIPQSVVDLLGLQIDGQDTVKYADGHTETVGVVSPIRFELLERHTTDDAYVLGSEVLIGQTILEKLDLLADCKNRKLVPNPEHPNGPVLRI